MQTKTQRDISKVSMQVNGEYRLYRHRIEGAGTVIYQEEHYLGNVVEQVVDPRQSFLEWVSLRVAAHLGEVLS